MMNANFNPKVSIVIPVYNGSNYLKEAIDSALNQTYTNIEVIVVNDGSTDEGKTELIAKSYGDKIRYISYSDNGGVSKAVNVGIRNMQGEWFAWLSHDDLFSENRIKEDVIFFQNNPEAKIMFCRIHIVDKDLKLIREIEVTLHKVTNCREAMDLGGVDMCSMTIHKSCFEQVGLFNEMNRTTQDVEMNLKLSSRFMFYLNQNSITFRRDHKDRGTYLLSEQHKKDLKILGELVYYQLSIYDFFPSLSFGNSKNLEWSHVWQYMGNLYNLFQSHDYAIECYFKQIQSIDNLIIRIITLLRFLKHRTISFKDLVTLAKMFWDKESRHRSIKSLS